MAEVVINTQDISRSAKVDRTIDTKFWPAVVDTAAAVQPTAQNDLMSKELAQEILFFGMMKTVRLTSVNVLFNTEVLVEVIRAFELGNTDLSSRKDITFLSDDPAKTELANKFGVTVETSISNMKKKDFTILNPPYSKGDDLLYITFFKRALELTKDNGTVVCVMPHSNPNSTGTRLKEHNIRVKTHSTYVSENVTSHFKVGMPDIRYIIASPGVKNDVKLVSNPLDNVANIMPERARLNPLRGQSGCGVSKNHDANGIAFIAAIHRGNKKMFVNVSEAFSNRVCRNHNTKASHLVLINENPSMGVFNTAIIENDGTRWGDGVFALEADSQEDAEALAAHIVSDDIVLEVQLMLEAKGVYSATGEMISKLPAHK